MCRSDFVVPVGADKQQVHSLVIGGEIADEVEGGAIQPLQIVYEQHERMIGSRKRGHEVL